MSGHTVRLLHVEDDPMQQRMLAHHLNAFPDYAFAITVAASEQLAMECFQKTKFDMVLLDYELALGDGLHLLGYLRELDPIIPIIAISEAATSEIADQLVQAGADDYFNKRALKSAALATSIQSALLRAETVRKKTAGQMTEKLSDFTNQWTALCVDYVCRIDARFLRQLDSLGQSMKIAFISVHELQQMHDIATSRLETPIGLDLEQTRCAARALLYELYVRVYGDPNISADVGRFDDGD